MTQRAKLQALYDAFCATDRAWSAEIEKICRKGEWPGDVRYTERAKGEPGTPLRAAYEARKAAQDAWYAAGGYDAFREECRRNGEDVSGLGLSGVPGHEAAS